MKRVIIADGIVIRVENRCKWNRNVHAHNFHLDLKGNDRQNTDCYKELTSQFIFCSFEDESIVT